ncbi:MAG: 16S rRNA (guanine(527)-N(7))-methyltransferase RsmG [Gammaproteobacteria bacterium]|nr:16S rRNA (guanine(527)-N(7))-methyltransferase RsmG [Gammaproteobacteria bacterium]MCW9058792.1 16S rRNA (guanine(527)-N(7))-methyltransferase RsmG [Gammaproteobacteria bacterium]
MTPQARLQAGLQSLHLPLSTTVQEQLLQFVQLLIKWNRVYNLTSVRKPDDIIVRHILDSLVVVPHLEARRVLDVGTGAGLPGIPLSLACPDTQFVLLDSNNKKVRFVRQAIAEMGLDNVSVEQTRVEDYRPDQPFDVVVSRAYSSLAEMHAQVERLLAPDGRLLAMKGVYPLAEMDALKAAGIASEVVPLQVPGLDAERNLVILKAS